MPKNRLNKYLKTDNKIILVLLSGLGGLQSGPNLLTELQQAHKPHLNALARKSLCGLIHPVAAGVIPPVGIGLLHLLGYEVGRKKENPSFLKKYGLTACAFTSDPVVIKICTRLGIHVRKKGGDTQAAIADLAANYANYNFFLLHVPEIAEQALLGDYYEKVKTIESFDARLPELTSLNPTALAITSDCSIPTALKSVSWHPVPLILHAPNCRYDNVQSFDEIACLAGGLGIIAGTNLMPLLLANAGKCKPLSF